MGDSRALIKIEFSIYGKDFKQELWINYYPEDGAYGLDRRVREFFEESYEAAREDYDRKIYEREKQFQLAAEENAERALLEKLKAKYEPKTGSKLEN